MWWETLIATAFALFEQADKIITIVKTLPGVVPEDVDKVVARNRAERAAKLAEARKIEWPDG